MNYHTLRYSDAGDLLRQIETLRLKLFTSVEQEAYETVRARYPNLAPSAFTMRLRRFKGTYPRTWRYRTRKRIGDSHLFVTNELHEWLNRPLRAKG